MAKSLPSTNARARSIAKDYQEKELPQRVFYSPELVADICSRISVGESVNQICMEPGYPDRSTFYDWICNKPEVREAYELALDRRADAMAAELLSIADQPVGFTDSGATDSGAVAKQKLQVDTRKWLLSKMAPKKYGDKVEQTIIGADGGPVQKRITVVFGDE